MAVYADKAIRGTVHGQVQGVGFRYTTRRMAHELGVVGWVRNLRDGSVEVWAQGTSDAVDGMQRFLTHGPPGAVVSSFDVDEVDPDHALTGFDVHF